MDEAKKELEKIKYLKALIKSTRMEIEEFEGICYSPSSPNYKNIGGKSNNNSSPTEKNAMMLLELHEKHKKAITDYCNEFVVISGKINMLGTQDKATLQMYYVDNLSLRQIAALIYTNKNVVRSNLQQAIKNYAILK